MKKKRLEEKQKLGEEENDCNFERKERNTEKRRREKRRREKGRREKRRREKRRNESGMESDLFVIRFLTMRENSG